MERARGINLGRIYNKYFIVDIFFSSAERNARQEADTVLWVCSRRHRRFLPAKFSLYTRNIDWMVAWH